MTESEFLALAEGVLGRIEGELERIADVLDVEWCRTGNVLEIELIEDGSKIIVNSQASMQEIWVAARSGGFHYRHDKGRWVNTKDRTELFAALSRILNEQGGVNLVLDAGS